MVNCFALKTPKEFISEFLKIPDSHMFCRIILRFTVHKIAENQLCPEKARNLTFFFGT